MIFSDTRESLLKGVGRFRDCVGSIRKGSHVGRCSPNCPTVSRRKHCASQGFRSKTKDSGTDDESAATGSNRVETKLISPEFLSVGLRSYQSGFSVCARGALGGSICSNDSSVGLLATRRRTAVPYFFASYLNNDARQDERRCLIAH